MKASRFDAWVGLFVVIGGAALLFLALEVGSLLGLNFDECSAFMFSASFEDCVLNMSSFYKMNIKGTKFVNTSLQEVDFRQANCTSCLFAGCDMGGALFDKSNLDRADFRTAYNYAFDPVSNRVKKAKFSLPEVVGLLCRFDIDIE